MTRRVLPRRAAVSNSVHRGRRGDVNATEITTRGRTPGGAQSWRATLPRLSQVIGEYLLLLPLGAAIALVWVNLYPESYYRLTYAIAFAVNDIGMVLFFALVGKEVIEATAPGGVLHSWRRATLPVIAAAGAAIAAALLYVAFVRAVDEPMLERGWAVPMATDVALAYVIARIIFPQHPACPSCCYSRWRRMQWGSSRWRCSSRRASRTSSAAPCSWLARSAWRPCYDG
jgi:Na+/H+ antiporter 1